MHPQLFGLVSLSFSHQQTNSLSPLYFSSLYLFPFFFSCLFFKNPIFSSPWPRLPVSTSVRRCGKRHVLSFPQCSAGCQCRRWTPSRQLCVCWALWFTVQGHFPQTGNLWKLPYWSPSPQVSFWPSEVNQSKETGNQGANYTSLLCATIDRWSCTPFTPAF